MPALGWAFVGEELLQFVWRRERACDVERGAADERGVVAKFAGRDAQLLELGVNEVVDVIVSREVLRELEPLVLRHNDGLRADGKRIEARHHERLATLAGGDNAALGHFRR